MPAATKKSDHRTLRHRGRLNGRFGFVIRAPVPLFYPDVMEVVNIFSAAFTIQAREKILLPALLLS
jgi:hypothetical protein